ncbi:inter-alpha-trypsin inhibitor heavy chain h3 [Plakobranchus ocellatus]|uniref:Inter-alpha-trypsin inhibitor heavy chain h3 n=1 Tax=Plakobranchus ocellatus TaxID=259542 RepID=A0AAV3XXL4_9GAST|nr:inter-alpha-trypsin inhibitor heavy chain h3 [Plakobranchus ocellatus]
MMVKSVWLLFALVVLIAMFKGNEASSTTRVESFQVRSDIRFRFATTEVSSRIRNLDNKTQEVSFDVTMPDQAFMVAFFMIIDGERYDGQVRKRQTAIGGNQAVQTPQQAPRNANIFAISVNVTAGSVANFTLTYQEKLLRSRGFYEYEIYINPGQVVPDFFIDVKILESSRLGFVRAPAIRTDDLVSNCLAGSDVEGQNDVAVINRLSPTTASIQFRPNETQQEVTGDGISGRFVVQYDVEHVRKGGNLIVYDTYFAHIIVFDSLNQTLPKDIIFVLDESGSMSGIKIEQLKEAMYAIVSDLKPQDRFNIITFSSNTENWESGLVQANVAAIDRSKDFVRRINANGGTNINDALLDALSNLRGQQSIERISMIFFLTDGEATEGVTNTDAIVRNVVNANTENVPFYCLAFGKNADLDLLRDLCDRDGGFTTEIFEESDAAEQVGCLYDVISDVNAENVTITYGDSVDPLALTQTIFPLVFSGTEIIVLGRFRDGDQNIKYEITGSERSGNLSISSEEGDFNVMILSEDEAKNPLIQEPQARSRTVERMWAFQTITENLVKKDKYTPDSNTTEALLEDVFVKSLTYNFVTPLTSMVVDTPGQGLAEFRQANMEDEIFDYTVFNFTAPPTPTTVMTTTQTTSDPNGSGAVGVHLHTYIIISILTLLLFNI